jgi:glucose dehydrogenase
VSSSPAVVDGTLFVGSADTHLYALDAANGAQRWTFETAGPVHSSPAVVDGTVYVGSEDNHVYALGTETKVYGAPGDQRARETRTYQCCPNCGTELSAKDSPAFCPHCGAKQ